MIATLPDGSYVRLRFVEWCKRHDIPWASHIDIDVVIDHRCVRGRRLVEDRNDWKDHLEAEPSTSFSRGSSEPAMHDVTDRRHPAGDLPIGADWANQGEPA